MRHDPRRLAADNYPFSITIAPRFADMDILRHLNNLALAECHEEARVRFLCTLFGEDFLFRKRPYRLLIAHAGYDYLHEAHYPLPLKAHVAISRLGHTSFDLALALFQEGRCVCLCDVTGVVVNENGPTSLPDELMIAFRQHLLREA